MNNIDKIRHYLKVVRRATDLIEELLEEEEYLDIDQILREPPKRKKQRAVAPIILEEEEEEEEEFVPLPPVKRMPEKIQIAKTKVQEPVVKTVQPPKDVTPPVDELYLARKKHVQDLLSIDVWPVAVESHLEAAATSEDQINRANAMLDMMVHRPIEDSTFLDFGCGAGWVAKQALKRGALSATGYDLISNSNWHKDDPVTFTNVFKDIADKKYDMIMLYDVLDHCQDPEELMKQVRSVVKPNGVVYVRNHPWTSKHASHLYKNGLNKAYIHLFLSWEELVDQGYTPEFTRQEKDPFPAYGWWFEGNEFTIEKENFHRNLVNEFFFSGDFKTLIMNEQQIDATQIERFYSDMEVEFVDYILTPK